MQGRTPATALRQPSSPGWHCLVAVKSRHSSALVPRNCDSTPVLGFVSHRDTDPMGPWGLKAPKQGPHGARWSCEKAAHAIPVQTIKSCWAAWAHTEALAAAHNCWCTADIIPHPEKCLCLTHRSWLWELANCFFSFLSLPPLSLEDFESQVGFCGLDCLYSVPT